MGEPPSSTVIQITCGDGILSECFLCGKTDREVVLMPVRVKGEDKWVCAKCIPKLIHGG